MIHLTYSLQQTLYQKKQLNDKSLIDMDELELMNLLIDVIPKFLNQSNEDNLQAEHMIQIHFSKKD